MKQYRIVDILLEATMWTCAFIVLMSHVNVFINYYVNRHAIFGLSFSPGVTGEMLSDLFESNPYPAISNFDYWMFYSLMTLSLYFTIKRVMESRGYKVKFKPENESHDTTEDRE